MQGNRIEKRTYQSNTKSSYPTDPKEKESHSQPPETSRRVVIHTTGEKPPFRNPIAQKAQPAASLGVVEKLEKLLTEPMAWQPTPMEILRAQ